MRNVCISEEHQGWKQEPGYKPFPLQLDSSRRTPTSPAKSKSLLGIFANGIFQHLRVSLLHRGEQEEMESNNDGRRTENMEETACIPSLGQVQPRKAGFDFKPLGKTIIWI